MLQKLGLEQKKIYFVTDGQKRDYLSRASQRARGATKNAMHTYYVKIYCMVTIEYFMYMLRSPLFYWDAPTKDNGPCRVKMVFICRLLPPNAGQFALEIQH